MWLCPLEPFLWRLFTISLSSLTPYKHVSLDCIMPGISEIWFPSTDCQLQTLFWLPTLFIAFDPIKQTNKWTNKTTKNHQTNPQNKTAVHVIFLPRRSNPLGSCFPSMHIAMTAHLSVYLRSQVATPDPNTLKTYRFCLCIWAVQGKPSLPLSEWATSPPTRSHPISKHTNRLVLTSHVIHWSSMRQSCPCRQKKLLEHLPPALSILPWVQITAHTKQPCSDLGSKQKNTLGRD